MSSKYKKLTQEQKDYIAKPLDHKKLCSAIQKKHGDTMRYVAKKYNVDSKPVFVDKGNR